MKFAGLRVKATYNIKGKGCDLCNRGIVKSHAFQFPCCGQHGLMRFCSSFGKTLCSSFSKTLCSSFSSSFSTTLCSSFGSSFGSDLQ